MHVLNDLKAALPEAEIVPGDHVFQNAMVQKHPEEIKCMRLSNKMSEIAHARAVEFIKPGVRECEVLGVIMQTFYSYGMEVPQCNLIVASGENTAPIHRFASDRMIRRGDLVFMDLGGCFNGYFSDVTRTIVVGQPNQKQIDILQRGVRVDRGDPGHDEARRHQSRGQQGSAAGQDRSWIRGVPRCARARHRRLGVHASADRRHLGDSARKSSSSNPA